MSTPVINFDHMTNQVPKLWIFFFFLITALIIGFAISQSQEQELQDVTEHPVFQENIEIEGVRADTFAGMLDAGGNAIYLENQGAGVLGVQVGFVILSQPGFVVIFDNDDGVPGNPIGSSQLLDTGGEHLTVQLETALKDRAVYYAVLYHDDGDGAFEVSEDIQAVDSTESVVLMTFLSSVDTEPETGSITP